MRNSPAGAEIPLHLMEKAMGKQVVTLQHTEDSAGADIHTSACGGHRARADGCTLDELQTAERPCMSRFVLKDCSTMLEQGRSGGRNTRDEVL